MEDQRLLKELYFHGLLPREDVIVMLRSRGDFIVRATEPTGQQRCFVLSIMVNPRQNETDGIKHFIIRRKGVKYSIDMTSIFDSVADLVAHHRIGRIPMTPLCPEAVPTNPIERLRWELLHEDILLTRKLGEGAFGEVHKGTYGNASTGDSISVAVKLAKLEAMTRDQIKEITMEARVARAFRHRNVVKLYGVAALQEPLMLVLECAEDGDLKTYLRKHAQTLTARARVDMCAGAAFGLEYIHAHNYLHRDIAARNCLVHKGVVKISDFGLTREGAAIALDSGSRLPIKSLAPECLRTKVYTQKSEVWAYGVLCWEVWQDGSEPYAGMSAIEVKNFVDRGNTLTFGDNVPLEPLLVIRRCFAVEQDARLSFQQMSLFFQRSQGCARPFFSVRPRPASVTTPLQLVPTPTDLPAKLDARTMDAPSPAPRAWSPARDESESVEEQDTIAIKDDSASRVMPLSDDDGKGPVLSSTKNKGRGRANRVTRKQDSSNRSSSGSGQRRLHRKKPSRDS